MPKVCAVTGPNGLVGSACCEIISAKGFQILPLQRPAFELGKDMEPEFFRGVDALVHCAYDFRLRSWPAIHTVNVEGSVKLLKAAAAAGVKKIVFISSVSAFEGCRSLYGQGKLEVERVALSLGAAVIRPGLVYGSPGRGLYSSLEVFAKLPLIPVFDGGQQPFVLVHIDDLKQAVSAILEMDAERVKKVVTAAHSQVIAFKDIFKALSAKRGKRARFFSIPGSLGLLGLRLLEALGLPSGFRSDSLVGMLYPNPNIDFSAAQELGLKFRPFLDAGSVVQPKQGEWVRQWSRFKVKEDMVTLFTEWIYPNTLDDFRGKRVLDAGCGHGQHSRLMAQYAREVVGADLNTTEIASEETKTLPNVKIEEGDIARIDFPQPFDIVCCIGVIHHTDNPDATFANLKRLTRKGGRLVVWAYSYEGNFLNRTALEWIKELGLVKLPMKAVELLAYALTLLLYPVVWSVYLLPLKTILPFYDYFANFRRFSFHQNLLNVFDKLNAPQTHFISRQQVERWFNEQDFEAVHISTYKGVSWRGSGTKK